MKILYFAWLRERLNRGEEEVFPPPSVQTVSGLMDWLAARDPAAETAFANRSVIRIAVDAKLASQETVIGPSNTVAFFPPMTGG